MGVKVYLKNNIVNGCVKQTNIQGDFNKKLLNISFMVNGRTFKHKIKVDVSQKPKTCLTLLVNDLASHVCDVLLSAISEELTINAAPLPPTKLSIVEKHATTAEVIDVVDEAEDKKE